MTNYDNIPESLQVLRDCIISGYDPKIFDSKQWREICNSLDYVAMKLGYKEAWDFKQGYEKIKEYPKNQRGNNA